MLIYIEYRSRRPGVELEIFHKITGRRTNTWSDEYGDDQLILNIGRTWRLGPEPEYLTAYYTPNAGVERLAEWERIFTSGEADTLEAQTRAVGRLDVASCLYPLAEPTPGTGGPYFGEYFDIVSGASRDDVAAFYRERAEAFPDLVLHLLGDRIGLLGPDPRGLAVWGIGGYGRLEAIATSLDGVDAPIRPTGSGVYRDVGQEIL